MYLYQIVMNNCLSWHIYSDMFINAKRVKSHLDKHTECIHTECIEGNTMCNKHKTNKSGNTITAYLITDKHAMW